MQKRNVCNTISGMVLANRVELTNATIMYAFIAGNGSL